MLISTEWRALTINNLFAHALRRHWFVGSGWGEGAGGRKWYLCLKTWHTKINFLLCSVRARVLTITFLTFLKLPPGQMDLWQPWDTVSLGETLAWNSEGELRIAKWEIRLTINICSASCSKYGTNTYDYKNTLNLIYGYIHPHRNISTAYVVI